MLEPGKIVSWVDVRIYDRLQELKLRMPHTPTLTMVATTAVQAGLDALGNDIAGLILDQPEQAGPRRAFTLRLPRHLYERVLQLSQTMPAASTPSAALHLLLWVGVGKLLGKRSEEQSETMMTSAG